MLRLEMRELSALLAFALGAGCIEVSSGQRRDAASAPASAADAGHASLPDPGSGIDSAGGTEAGLSVSLGARPASICPGQCSVLTAALPTGRPPLTWRWSHDLPATQGPHQVCPSSTTTYSLEVEDTPVTDPEFPGRAARGVASVAVAVRSDCAGAASVDASAADASVPEIDAAGVDAASPATPAEPCTVRIPLDPPLHDNPFMWGSASSDAAGNLILAAVLTGSAQVGAGPRLMTAPHVTRVFVAKYSPRCELQWARFMGEPQETTHFGSMEVNAAGQIALTRTYFVEPAQPGSYHSELLTLTPDGQDAWSIDSVGGNFFHVAQMHGLAWGHDGSLAVFGLPQLCAHPETPGACVAKVTPQGVAIFGRRIGGAMGAGVALDSTGSLIAAGLSGNQGIAVDALPSPQSSGPFAYVVKFDANGVPQWLRTQPIDRDIPRNSTPGFVSVTRDQSLLVAWNDALARPGRTLQQLTRLWQLSPEGAQQALSSLDIVGSNGASEPTYVASARGELLSAEYLNHDPSRGRGPTPGSTQLKWHAPDGSTLRSLELTEGAFSVPSSVRLSPADEPIVVSLEYGETRVPGAQTALVLRRLAR